MRALAPEAEWAWSEHLLAHLIDEMRVQRYLTQLIHTGKGKRKPDPPQPIKRPWAERDDAKPVVPKMTRYQVLVRARGRDYADERLADDPSLATTWTDGTPVGEGGD